MDWSTVNPDNYYRVLLHEYKRGTPRPREQSEILRQEYDRVKTVIMPLQGAQCFLCKTQAEHRHHVQRLSMGGTNDIDNLVALCPKCYGRLNHPQSHRETSYNIAQWQQKEADKLQVKRNGSLSSKSETTYCNNVRTFDNVYTIE